jgi:hypothetical protein
VALLSAGYDYLALNGLPLRLHADTNYCHLLEQTIVVALLGLIFCLFVNVNRFSLHGMYRDRIIRTFLGATRETRKPSPFTGFDPDDNIHLELLWPNGPAQCEKVPPQIHIVNIALNVMHFKSDLNGESELALQERKALPFTASARFIGSGNLSRPDGKCGCFRPASAYALGVPPQAQNGTWKHSTSKRGTVRRLGACLTSLFYRDQVAKTLSQHRKGLSLGTALTLSGAAASPNMGYHSSPALSVLLTLFNVRLGGWYGNPGPAGSDSFWRVGPSAAFKPLLYELLGLADDNRAYVYLSDGGHFENLGVYEMIRRRCRFMIVCDAGCDPDSTLEDLGSLVRKVSIDFGVKIDFAKRLTITARQTPAVPGSYAAVADVVYPERPETPSTLLYVKPGFHGTEPVSARSYGLTHPKFPHEPTTDQWFGESQFEAYRSLGEYIIEEVIGSDAHAINSIADFFAAAARKRWLHEGLEEHNRT